MSFIFVVQTRSLYTMIKKLIILSLIFVFGQTAFAQNYKKAFKALETKNYTSARVIFMQAQKDISSKSIGDYGMAVVLRSTSLRQDDLYSAWKNIESSKAVWPKCDEDIKKKYISYFNEEKIKSEKKTIDKKLFSMVKSSGKVKDIQRFIDECPNSEYYNDAVSMRNAAAFKTALNYNTIVAWNKFIENYPEAEQYEDAKSRMYEIAWQQCISPASIEKYTAFIKQYPDAPQAVAAHNKVIEMEYERALAINTPEAYQSFIDKYPQSSQAALLMQKGVVNAYDNAIKFQSIELCNEFLSKFPNTEYTLEINILRDTLAYLEAKKINTPEAYHNFVSTYPNANQVPLVLSQLSELNYSKIELAKMNEKNKIKNRKLKSVTSYNVDAGDTTKKVIDGEKQYDAFGNITYSFKQVLPQVKEIVKYHYDSAGNQLLKEQSLVNDKLQQQLNYSYDSRGLCVSIKQQCQFNCHDTAGIYSDTLVYDEKRNLIKQITMGPNDSLVESHIYHYDVKGNRTREEMSILMKDSMHSFLIICNYDGEGRLIQMSKKDMYGDVIEVGSYSYDGLGNITTSTYYDAAGTLMRTYFYDERGLISNEIMKFEEHSGNNEIRIYLYKFL